MTVGLGSAAELLPPPAGARKEKDIPASGGSTLAGDDGAGSVLVVMLVASVLLLTGLALPLNQALTMRQLVANAADAAALAAADTASGFSAGYPCDNAAEAARLNGAQLGECVIDATEARVTAVRLVLGVKVMVAARAGPPERETSGHQTGSARQPAG